MSSSSPESAALGYTNRFGRTYYLHEGRTKTGNPRYLVRKAVGEGPRSTMPSGFEFSESLNGVVSVRRVRSAAKGAYASDVATVEAELARHPHLSHR